MQLTETSFSVQMDISSFSDTKMSSFMTDLFFKELDENNVPFVFKFFIIFKYKSGALVNP